MNVHKLSLPNRSECKSYTLFIDRDGVINQPIIGDYAKKPEDFIFCEGALDALIQLKKMMGRVILVTNQQGIQKGVMSEKNLEDVHLKMYNALKSNVEYFDLALFAPYLKDQNHAWRKPNTGMCLKAKEYFPDIDFTKAIMVGDSPSDMALAEPFNVLKVRIRNSQFSFDNQDFTFNSLADFVTKLSN